LFAKCKSNLISNKGYVLRRCCVGCCCRHGDDKECPVCRAHLHSRRATKPVRT
jgi:hypothetical protein